ncbi:hypothetical protein TNCV_3382891 [Trichonephila clavipes]|nr:hypothetical protein TNCV_3382891 [Trichonephila clavipes]
MRQSSPVWGRIQRHLRCRATLRTCRYDKDVLTQGAVLVGSYVPARRREVRSPSGREKSPQKSRTNPRASSPCIWQIICILCQKAR